MKRYILILAALGLVLALTGVSQAASVVTKETLKDWMDNNTVTVLDARTGRDWNASEFKIQGARRTDPKDVEDWKGSFAKGDRLVIYCA